MTLPMHGCACHGSKSTKKRVKPRGGTQVRGVHRPLAAHRSGTAGSSGPANADGTATPSGIRSRPLLCRTQVRTTASQLSVTLRAASKRFWTSAQLTTFQKALA